MNTLRLIIIAAAVLGLSACSFDASISTPHLSQKTNNPGR